MSRGVYLSVLLVAGVTLVARGPDPAGACSCVAMTDAEALAAAEVAFVGTVTASEHPDDGRPVWASTDPVTWTFAVERAFLGDVAADQRILSPVSSASCGLELAVGARYLVFAAAETPDRLHASLCNGTRPASADERPPGFPPGVRPPPLAASPGDLLNPAGAIVTPDRLWVAAVGALAAAALLAAVTTIATVRRRPPA